MYFNSLMKNKFKIPMSIYKIIILTIFIGTSVYSSYGQTDFKPIPESQLTSLKAQIKAKNAQINTLTCPFSQTKHLSMLKNPAVSEGIMYFKKPSQFRWEYTNNPRFIFAQNGQTIYTKSGDQVQIVKDNSALLYQEISKLVIQSVNGSILENSKEFTTQYEENKKYIKIVLTPKQRNVKKFISSIHLLLDKKSFLASQIIMNEPNGDYTTIKFDNISVNQPINESLFILK